MPIKLSYSSSNPNYIPLDQWIDQKIATLENNGDIEGANAVRAACNENAAAMEQANVTYQNNDNETILTDIVTPPAFIALHEEWLSTYNITCSVEEVTDNPGIVPEDPPSAPPGP